MASGQQQNAAIDLERELTCSICTDVLFQPLTLLDCLHTFCGACLKEWFSFQGRASSPPTFTCPSCRASVRGTKPNATVTTLLEMFLAANPERGKSEEEKEDMRKAYTAGDDVFPKVERRRRRGRDDIDEDEDRRIMEEVRQLSLQEVGVAGPRLEEPPRERRRRERSRDNREDGRRARTADGRAPASTYLSHRTEPRDRLRDERVAQQTRRVEHQSSLRSLLSVSELDSQEIQEEIMRQITEEGLLDGIDLNDINASQEEEITERIAQAYQRRQRDRELERDRVRRQEQRRSNPPSPRVAQEEEAPRRRQQAPSETSSTTSRPPVSRPHLLEVASGTERHHRRRSSGGSTPRTTLPSSSSGLAEHRSRQAARSATDLSDRPSTQENAERRRRMSQNERRATDPDRRPSALAQAARRSNETASNPNSPRTDTFGTSAASNRPAENGGIRTPRSTMQHNSDSLAAPRSDRPSNSSSPSLISTTANLEAPSTSASRPRSTSAAATSPRPTLYPEPSISCNRCGTAHIEYDLHYNCSKCNEGNYNLCLRCYRHGEGCLHWFGFGHAAYRKYQDKAPPGGYPPNAEQPHVLTGRRYHKPSTAPSSVASSGTTQILTEDNPKNRLQAGVFCAICSSFANSCYWWCDCCNDGEWGYCNSCINQSRHCTHSLQALCQASKLSHSRGSSMDGQPQSPSQPPESMPLFHDHDVGAVQIANVTFEPLMFRTRCDICKHSIVPSNTRYHCPQCNKGDYDICNSCYPALVASGKISAENGHHGWRRCLRGHRMCVVGFEDREDGRRRVVVREIVGGLQHDGEKESAQVTASPTSIAAPSSSSAVPASPDPASDPEKGWRWKEDDGSWVSGPSPHVSVPGRFPPDGGAGMRAYAMFGYFPNDGVKDELMFPRHAEIREVIDINGDWFHGRYCGTSGLFPGNYAQIIG